MRNRRRICHKRRNNTLFCFSCLVKQRCNSSRHCPTGLYAGSLNFCREAQNCGPEVVFARNKNVWELKFTFVQYIKSSQARKIFYSRYIFLLIEKRKHFVLLFILLLGSFKTYSLLGCKN